MLECTLSRKPSVDLKDFSCDLSSAEAYVKYDEGFKERLYTLQLLYEGSSAAISKGMAEKIAGSGLRYAHLLCVYRRDGAEGLASLLKAKHQGKPRVTVRKNIIDAICNHMASVST